MRNKPYIGSIFPYAKGIILIFCLFLCTVAGADQDIQIQEGTVLIAVYTAGGSLETEYGLITEDIEQMVDGALNTTPDDVEVLVAYGGAQKPGWEGMTIANISHLTADLTDGELGNETYAYVRYPDANMGSAKALSDFLLWIRSHYQYDRVFLILIGHGEAYTGMLFDQNHHSDPLTLTEVTEALQQGGFNVELIGFDTCMMSSLEAASRVAGYAAYMIASEESEPAEGWQYDTFISYVSSHPDAPVEELASVLLDDYLKNTVQGKTLSLLNLEYTGIVTANLDQLSKDLIPHLDTPEGVMSLSEAFFATQQFGLTANGTRDPAMMDLIDAAQVLKEMDSSLTEPVEVLISSVQDMVIQSINDDGAPRAHGLSILSPVQINPAFFHYYQDEAAITPSWDRFMFHYLEAFADIEEKTQ